MDAVKFIKERKRLCSSYLSCAKCPAFRDNDTCLFSPTNGGTPDEQIKILSAWSAAHPLKTRQSVFMEQWPDVYLDRNRVISVSPCTVSKEYRDMDCDLRDCAECRKEFWMKEVE